MSDDSPMEYVLSLKGVRKRYHVGGLLSRTWIHALDDIELQVPGENPTVVSIVGESGSGKTTLAKVLLGLVAPEAGAASVGGFQVFGNGRSRQTRELLHVVQPIFQNPFEAFSSHRTVDTYLRDTAVFVRRVRDEVEVETVLSEVLETVGLKFADVRGKYQNQFSGGELQRVAIARALVAQPRVIIADEPVSMIDASLRMSIVNLFLMLTQERRMHFVYITHDLATAYYISDYIAIMYQGCIMEFGRAMDVLGHPLHPYTSLLLESVPAIGRKWSATADQLPESGSHGHGLPGCRFAPRCPKVTELCTRARPEPSNFPEGRTAYCHHIDGI